jgi:copper resistance protein C
MTRSTWAMPAVIAVLTLMLPSSLVAHVQLDRSEPEHESTVDGSPARIAVWFDQDLRLVSFEVSGPDGPVALRQRPDRTLVSHFETAPSSTLAPGEYTVRWRGLAEDGHVMFDEFHFAVR